MIFLSRKIAILVVLAVAAASAHGDSEPAPGALMPPSPPRHEQRMLDNAGDLARDLAEIVAFLEQGQSYFKAFKKGTHSAQENAALVRFLETYERERDIARREVEVLGEWVKKKSELEPREESAPKR